MVSSGVNLPHKNGPIPLWLSPHFITSKSPGTKSSSTSCKYDDYDNTKYKVSPLLLDLPGKLDHQAIHCPTGNFGPLSRGSTTNPILMSVFDTYLTPRSPAAWVKTFPILNVASVNLKEPYNQDIKE